MSTGSLCFFFAITALVAWKGTAQVARGTSRFEELVDQGTAALDAKLALHPDITDPKTQPIPNSAYSYVPPDIEDFTLNMLIDPVSTSVCLLF
jgi:hypothetical protein